MKKAIFALAFSILCIVGANAQTKKDGTPDMRYRANKETYGRSYTAPNYSTPKTTERNYSDGGRYKVQNGYRKSNGTYVAPHLKTTPDNKTYNNYKPKKTERIR